MSCGKYRTRRLSLLYEFFDGISGWKFGKKHVRRCYTCTVFHLIQKLLTIKLRMKMRFLAVSTLKRTLYSVSHKNRQTY